MRLWLGRMVVVIGVLVVDSVIGLGRGLLYSICLVVLVMMKWVLSEDCCVKMFCVCV